MLQGKRLDVREKQTVENEDRIEPFLLQREKYRFCRQAHYSAAACGPSFSTSVKPCNQFHT